MQLLADVIDTILNGSDAEKQQFQRTYFELAETPKILQDLGLLGEKFTIRYGVITHHKNKDADHDFSETEWKKLCEKISMPFAVAKYGTGYDLFLDFKHNEKYVLVGVEVKNTGKDQFVNAVRTVFARNISGKENIVYASKKITPEQQSLLDGANSRQYPANGR